MVIIGPIEPVGLLSSQQSVATIWMASPASKMPLLLRSTSIPVQEVRIVSPAEGRIVHVGQGRSAIAIEVVNDPVDRRRILVEVDLHAWNARLPGFARAVAGSFSARVVS